MKCTAVKRDGNPCGADAPREMYVFTYRGLEIAAPLCTAHKDEVDRRSLEHEPSDILRPRSLFECLFG